ncbi:MAG: hypothetical protein MHMPM18_001488 [Marteilia pararefringens]
MLKYLRILCFMISTWISIGQFFLHAAQVLYYDEYIEKHFGSSVLELCNAINLLIVLDYISNFILLFCSIIEHSKLMFCIYLATLVFNLLRHRSINKSLSIINLLNMRTTNFVILSPIYFRESTSKREWKIEILRVIICGFNIVFKIINMVLYFL